MIELILGFTAGVAIHRFVGKRRTKKAASKGQPVYNSPPKLSLKEPVARAAVVFMSLPPIVSASLFSELAPEVVQKVTVAITQLPAVRPQERQEILDGFSQMLGIRPDKLDEAAGEEPALIAKALSGFYGLN